MTPISGPWSPISMPSNLLLPNLNAIKASLQLLNNSQLATLNKGQFVPQIQNLDQQLTAVATAHTAAVKAGTIDPAKDDEAFAASLVAFPDSLPGITSGVLLAVKGFEDGDVLSGIQGLMDACASLAPVIFSVIGLSIGSMAGGIGSGPGILIGGMIGAAIGAIFTMISDILGFFAPKAETVAVTVARLLKDQKADEAYSGIGRVHHSFLIYASTLNDACKRLTADLDPAHDRFHPAVTAKVIDEMNFVEGNTMTSYWDVIDWLSTSANQTHTRWPLILEASCNAYTVLLLAVIRLQTIVTSKAILERYRKAVQAKNQDAQRDLKELWSSAQAKLQVYAVSNRINLGELQGLLSAAHGHGTLWRLRPWLEVGLLDPQFSISGLGGDAPRLSITVCSQDQALSSPPYQQYAIAGNSRLYYWRVVSQVSGDKLVFQRNYDGGDSGETIRDVFATPGTDLTKPNHCFVYTVSEDYKKIQGRFFDANGKPLDKGADGKPINPAFFTYDLPANDKWIESFTSVRAVHDPYSYADDPANGSLNAVDFIVYAIGKRRPVPNELGHFFVEQKGARYNSRDSIGFPIGDVIGLEVDQDYAWVYSASAAACATHASIALGSKSAAWTLCPNLPFPASTDPNKPHIQRLYACDDGTLVVDLTHNGGTFSADYRVDLKNRKITSFAGEATLTWTKVRDNSANSFEKLPLFCWPQYESLIDTLDALQKVFDRPWPKRS